MTTESFLHYWFSHNEQIIFWVFAGVLSGTGFLVVRSVLRKEGEAEVSPASIQAIEVTLKKVFEEKAGSFAASPAAKLEIDPAALEGDLIPAPVVAALREELETKKAELEKVSAQVQAHTAEVEAIKKGHQAEVAQLQTAATTSGGDPEEVTRLKSRIAELEGKLAEYSVIEDDIADLSMYKDENAKLKARIAELEAGGAATPVSAAPAEVEVTPAPESLPVAVQDDALMQEFAAAVADQRQAMSAQEAPAKADGSVDALDTDRMLAEMADLSQMPVEEDPGAKIMDIEPDTDKMAQEASEIDKAS